MKSSGTFCYVFQYWTAEKENQHGSRKYDDLKNWLNMTSHETLYWHFEHLVIKNEQKKYMGIKITKTETKKEKKKVFVDKLCFNPHLQ